MRRRNNGSKPWRHRRTSFRSVNVTLTLPSSRAWRRGLTDCAAQTTAWPIALAGLPAHRKGRGAEALATIAGVLRAGMIRSMFVHFCKLSLRGKPRIDFTNDFANRGSNNEPSPDALNICKLNLSHCALRARRAQHTDRRYCPAVSWPG
jgi:hypothetical protein